MILILIIVCEMLRIGMIEYLMIIDNFLVLDWFGNFWGFFVYMLLINLCGIFGILLLMVVYENGLLLGMYV